MRSAAVFGMIWLSLVWPPLSEAHPHAWAEGRLEARVTDRRLETVTVEITMDEVFSQLLLADHAPGQTALDETSSRSLGKAFLRFFTDQRYLVLGTQAGVPLAVPEPQTMVVRLGADHRLTFRYTIPWVLDLVPGGLVSLTLYDESFFVDVQWASSRPVTVLTTGPGRVQYGLQPYPPGRPARQGGPTGVTLSWSP